MANLTLSYESNDETLEEVLNHIFSETLQNVLDDRPLLPKDFERQSRRYFQPGTERDPFNTQYFQPRSDQIPYDLVCKVAFESDIKAKNFSVVRHDL